MSYTAQEKSILVIDPTIETLMPLVEYLRSQGYDVRSEFDYGVGAKIINRYRPDLLIIADPPHGEAAATFINNGFHRGIPVIGLTNSRGPGSQRMIDAGACWSDDKFYVCRAIQDGSALRDTFANQVKAAIDQPRAIT